MIQRVLIVTVLVAAAWFGWRWLFPDDEAQIRALLTRVADAVAKEGAEESDANIGGLAAVAALQNDFTVDATVDAGEPLQRLSGRQAIVSAAAGVRVAVRNLQVEFPDVEITVADDRQTASALVTAEARYDDRTGRRAMDARELEMMFAREDDRWMISSVTLIQPLKRLQ